MSDEEMAAVVSGMLWTSYQELDRLERSLGVLIGPAEPSGRPGPADVTPGAMTGPSGGSVGGPVSRSSGPAALAGTTLTHVLQVLHAHPHEVDTSWVLRDVRANAVAVMATLAELMLQVSFPPAADRVDLEVVARRASHAMSAFAVAPAAPVPPQRA